MYVAAFSVVKPSPLEKIITEKIAFLADDREEHVSHMIRSRDVAVHAENRPGSYEVIPL